MLFVLVLFWLVDGFFGMGSTSSGLDGAGVMGRCRRRCSVHARGERGCCCHPMETWYSRDLWLLRQR